MWKIIFVILSLMKESAKSKPVPPPAFNHKFTRIKVNDPPFLNDMTEKEAKQVGYIHALLVAPLAGVDDAGAIVNHVVFDGSVTLLGCRLDSKNMKALKFVCGDLKLPRLSLRCQWIKPPGTTRKIGYNAFWNG